MNKKIKNQRQNFEIKTVMTVLNKILIDNAKLHPETAEWIVVKTLRVFKKDFSKIKNIDQLQFERMIKFGLRIRNGETLAQVYGEVEFYGNILKTAPSVFSPRLSTETLVNTVINLNSHKKNLKILDLCTGSGSVAVTLAKHLDAIVYGVDISNKSIKVAQENAKRLNVDSKCKFEIMDILEPWDKLKNLKFDIIVSNPPYWNPQKIFASPEIVKANPIIGFDGGEDGFKYIQKIVENSTGFLTKNGELYLEIDPDQVSHLNNMLSKSFKDIIIEKDYRGLDRVIGGVVNKENKQIKLNEKPKIFEN